MFMRRTRKTTSFEAAKRAGDGQFVPGVKRRVVFGPNTRVDLPERDGLRITRAVPVATPTTLPKLENTFCVRVDDETKARLDRILVMRGRRGLRLCLADLAREALLGWLDKEESKLQRVKPKPITEAA